MTRTGGLVGRLAGPGQPPDSHHARRHSTIPRPTMPWPRDEGKLAETGPRAVHIRVAHDLSAESSRGGDS